MTRLPSIRGLQIESGISNTLEGEALKKFNVIKPHAKSDRVSNESLVKVSEESFQSSVIHFAILNGWYVHAERPAMSSKGYRTPIQGKPGWPDVVLCHPGKKKFYIFELKSNTGRLSVEQQKWIKALNICGIKCQVFWPSDWPEIEQILK
jgi:hypothetical protein